MPSQKFKTTVFVPKLTEITSIIEIDVDPHDSKLDIEYKLLKKMAIYKESGGCLLNRNRHPQALLNRLIDFLRIQKYRGNS